MSNEDALNMDEKRNNSRTHAEMLEYVSAWLDGELCSEDAAWVSQWVKAHPDVSAQVEVDRSVWDLLSTGQADHLVAPVPAGFSTRMRGMIEQESLEQDAPKLRSLRGEVTSSAFSSPPNSRPSWWMAAAAALLLGIGATWTYFKVTSPAPDAFGNLPATTAANNQTGVANGVGDEGAAALLEDVPVDLLPHLEFLASLDDDSFASVVEGEFGVDGLPSSDAVLEEG